MFYSMSFTVSCLKFNSLIHPFRITVIKQTKKCWQECGEFGILVSILSYCSNLKQSQNNEYELIYIKSLYITPLPRISNNLYRKSRNIWI